MGLELDAQNPFAIDALKEAGVMDHNGDFVSTQKGVLDRNVHGVVPLAPLAPAAPPPMLQIAVPLGVGPGMTFIVQTPSGVQLPVMCPEGAGPGTIVLHSSIRIKSTVLVKIPVSVGKST